MSYRVVGLARIPTIPLGGGELYTNTYCVCIYVGRYNIITSPNNEMR